MPLNIASYTFKIREIETFKNILMYILLSAKMESSLLAMLTFLMLHVVSEQVLYEDFTNEFSMFYYVSNRDFQACEFTQQKGILY